MSLAVLMSFRALNHIEMRGTATRSEPYPLKPKYASFGPAPITSIREYSAPRVFGERYLGQPTGR